MSRKNQKASVASKALVKGRAKDTERCGEARATENPFATFSEWSSEADEKAYASL